MKKIGPIFFICTSMTWVGVPLDQTDSMKEKKRGYPMCSLPILINWLRRESILPEAMDVRCVPPPVPLSKPVSIKAIHLPIVTIRTMPRKQSVLMILPWGMLFRVLGTPLDTGGNGGMAVLKIWKILQLITFKPYRLHTDTSLS